MKVSPYFAVHALLADRHAVQMYANFATEGICLIVIS